MRITGGKLRGHVLRPSMKGWPTRPTTDISKEALFNILTNRIDFAEVSMLDLFGGTGNHSWEFLSRGCRDVTYVDKHYACVSFVRQQRAKWGFSEEMTIQRMDVKSFIKARQRNFDYIFAGPPYELSWLDEIPSLIRASDLLRADGLFVLEHNPQHDFTLEEGYIESRNYGQTIFSFFSF